MVHIPNLRHLRLFSLTACLQSGRKAAEEAYVSQPAVTQAIASLERQFGCSLFARRSTGMYLTSHGEAIRARVDRFIDLLAEVACRVASNVRANGRRPNLSLDRMISSVQLSALAAVVRNRSFATAALELGMAQSSVHRAVRSFEKLAGERLVERAGRGISPTPLGEELAFLVCRALREIELAFCDTDSMRESAICGTLKVGVLPFTGITLVSEALTLASEQYPKAEFSVMDGHYDMLLRALRIGEIDVIVGALSYPPPVTDVAEELLFFDERLVVCRVGHPLSKQQHIDFSEITKFDWVVPRKGTVTRVRFDKLLGPAFGTSSPRMIETGSFSVMRGVLMQSDRLALLSHRGIAYEQVHGELMALPLSFGGASQPIGLTMRRDWRPTPLQASVIGLFRNAHAMEVKITPTVQAYSDALTRHTVA
jgi:DNA-binding transcriptional LysR family regulator